MRCARGLVFPALALTCLLAVGARAAAADSASLQFTVPAPDPVNAGETLALQALAINTGQARWEAGSYYWVGEIYDLEEHLVARTEQIAPTDRVEAGGVAAVTVPFSVPETMLGRHLYRIFLVKDSRTLIQSEFKPFQVLPKPIPETPKAVDYRVEGNVTVSYRNSSRRKWADHSGATLMNAVGKVKESSYLFNVHLLHQVGKAVDPYSILVTYYAPWGTIYGGDISPTLSHLSVNGMGLRGAMLEQRKDDWDWALMGGQTVTSQPGTAASDGRYARSLYAGKLGRSLPLNLNVAANYFLSADETGSLSTNPQSAKYRGPYLMPEKNNGYGLNMRWEPQSRLVLSLDYQTSRYFKEGETTKSDKAYKVDFGWERQYVKFKAYMQRAGLDFHAFGAPGVSPDRLTYSGAINVFPAPWYTLSFGGNQDSDNVDKKAADTNTQRVINMAHSLQFRTRTNVNVTASINSAMAKPSVTVNNKTTSMGLSVSQGLGRHNASMSLHTSQYRDLRAVPASLKSADRDSTTMSLSTNFSLRKANASMGITRSETKDKKDGSKSSSLTVSPSYSRNLRKDLVGMAWGTYTATKNTSPSFPADTVQTGLSSELTWSQTKLVSWTGGMGYNKNTNKFTPSEDYNELTILMRVSVSF